MKSAKKSLASYLISSASAIAASLAFSAPALAFVVTHQVRPNSNFDAAALSNSCSTIPSLSSPTQCNPALFPVSENQGISVNLVGKSNGNSIDNGYDLIFKPVSEDLLRRLFQQRNFNSFSLSTDIVFKTKLFELSYSPYYLFADIFIYNPAFPEISLNLVNRETLRLSSGTMLFEKDSRRLSFGASVFYYKHEYDNTNFSLLDLTSVKPGDLIKFSAVSGVAGDVGLFFEEKSWPISRFAVQVKNVGSKISTDPDKASSYYQQTNRFLFEPYSSVGIGKSFLTNAGEFNLNAELFSNKYFTSFEPGFATIAARYSIRLFSLLGAYSARYQNIGVRFDSQFFNVGLFYTREVDIGSYQGDPDRSIYTGIGVSL
ncbi:MAG: hypothetical protein ACXWSC_20675 [Bdellovibrionota bacterium]